MAALTITTLLAPFTAVTAGAADVTFTAGDTDTDTIATNGRDIILAWNTDGVNPYTVTISSVVDETNRTADITAYSLAAGDIAAFSCGLTSSLGWKDASTGLITVDVENAAVKWAIIRLPNGYPS